MTTGTGSAPAGGQAATGGTGAAEIINGAPGEITIDQAFKEWGASKGITPENFEKYARENPDFYKIANSYRNVEKLVGGDKLALPKDPNDENGWNQVFDRLGRPKDAKEYKFAETADKSLTEWAGPVFHKLGLTQKQAEGLNVAFDELLKQGETLTSAQTAEKAAAEKIQLEKDWGGNFKGNQEKATRAWNMMASNLGIPQTKIDEMQNVLGLRDSMRMLEFFSRGLKVTGDTFEGDGPGQRSTGATFSPEQAEAEKNKLLNDPGFAKRYRSGDKEARERLHTLNQIIGAAA